MYLTCGISCSDCTRGIINSGIKQVYLERGQGAQGKLWDEHEIRSIQMFKEAGVEIIFYDEIFKK
jgi:deoxycytidylate deaminase